MIKTPPSCFNSKKKGAKNMNVRFQHRQQKRVNNPVCRGFVHGKKRIKKPTKNSNL